MTTPDPIHPASGDLEAAIERIQHNRAVWEDEPDGAVMVHNMDLATILAAIRTAPPATAAGVGEEWEAPAFAPLTPEMRALQAQLKANNYAHRPVVLGEPGDAILTAMKDAELPHRGHWKARLTAVYKTVLSFGKSPIDCTRCSRGEMPNMSFDDGSWVEVGAVAGGANEHGMNGWLELIEHGADGTEKRREYVATDSPLYTTPASHDALLARVREDVAWAVERFGMWKAPTSNQEDALARLRALLANLDAEVGR